jgi:hypothetical protein
MDAFWGAHQDHQLRVDRNAGSLWHEGEPVLLSPGGRSRGRVAFAVSDEVRGDAVAETLAIRT